MEARTKVIFFRILFVLVVFVIFGGFIYQKFQENQHTSSPPRQEQKEQNTAESESTETVFPTNNQTSQQNNNKKVEDYYSKNDISDTKKITEGFIKAIYQFNGDDIFKGIRDATPFITLNLKKMMESEQEGITRPSSDFFYRELKNVEIKEPEEAVADAITWDVTVHGEIKNKKGVITDKDTTHYLVLIIKENNEYKVAEYSINPN